MIGICLQVLVLYGNLVVLGLLILQKHNRRPKATDYSVFRYIQVHISLTPPPHSKIYVYYDECYTYSPMSGQFFQYLLSINSQSPGKPLPAVCCEYYWLGFGTGTSAPEYRVVASFDQSYCICRLAA